MRRVVIAGMMAACGGTGETAGRDAAVVRCDEVIEIDPIGVGEPLYAGGQCAAAPRGPYPTRGCRLDLRGVRAGDRGTCGAELAAGSVGELIGEPIRIRSDELPMVVQLPEGAIDDGCRTLCREEDGETITRFGVRLLVEDVRTFLSIRVEPPWRFVTGNETSPTLCHDGYPTVLELGAPVACVFTYADEVDVITADPAPPPARLLIAADETSNEWSNCCLYPTP